MIPSAARALNASRTTVRDTPNSTARPASDGTGSPTRRRSARMRWLIARMAMSTSPPSASALDRARDRFIHPDHYDSCARFVCDHSPRRLSISISRRIGGLLGKGAGGRQEVGIRRDGAKTGLRRSRYRRRERRLRTNGAMHSSGSISAANASIAFVSLSAATRLGRRRTFPPRSACGLMAERSSPCSTGWRCGTTAANFRTLAIIEARPAGQSAQRGPRRP